MAETRALTDRFADAGKALYLVGGIVRDAISGCIRSELDIDLTTDATPDEIESIIRAAHPRAVWTQGKRFGTIGATFASGDGVRAYEITTHRSEIYRADSRKPSVRFATAVEEDLARRDFTVNAMAIVLVGPADGANGPGALIDPFGGADDLAGQRLRTPLSPDVSFSDDPLRMQRAARLIAAFELVPDVALVDAVTRLRGRMAIVSAERIRGELDKLLLVESPARGLQFLVDTGLAGVFLPELDLVAAGEQGDHQEESVRRTIAAVAAVRSDHVLRLAALMTVMPGSPEHRLRALKYSNEDLHNVIGLVMLHRRLRDSVMGSDGEVRRLVRDAGPLLGRLIELARADAGSYDETYARIPSIQVDELESRIDALRQGEDLDAIEPDLDGTAVMAHLGVRPGRDVGEALDMLLEHRLEHGPVGAAGARELLDRWWAERSANVVT